MYDFDLVWWTEGVRRCKKLQMRSIHLAANPLKEAQGQTIPSIGVTILEMSAHQESKVPEKDPRKLKTASFSSPTQS